MSNNVGYWIDTKTIQFTVPGEPVGKGRPRVVNHGGFSKAYTPEKTVIYENLVKTEYGIQTKGFRFPDDAAIRMKIVAFYAIPKSVSRKKRELMLSGMIRPTKKPDVDNLTKIIADSINTIAYRDDAQIVECYCSKYYSDTPRVEVKLQGMKGENDA